MNIYDYELRNISSLDDVEAFEEELQLMEAHRKINNRRRKQFRLERESDTTDFAYSIRLRRE